LFYFFLNYLILFIVISLEIHAIAKNLFFIRVQEL
jgi:hypothetical protein